MQGVYYRESTRRIATQLGITGYVRNLPDGRVEGLFQGPSEIIKKLIEWCKEGPSAARVDDIEIEWQNVKGKMTGFKVRRD